MKRCSMKRSSIMVAGMASLAAAAVLSGCSKASDDSVEPPAQTAAEAPARPAVIESNAVEVPPPMQNTDVIATVGDRTMTWGELNTKVDEAIEQYAKSSGQAIPAEQLPQAKQYFRKNIVMDFIQKNVLLDTAARDKIEVPDTVRAEKLAELTAAAVKAGSTLDEQMAKFPGGIEEAKKFLDEMLLIQVMMEQEVDSKVVVDPAEAKEMVDRVTAANALVDQEMADVKKQLDDGADFLKLAAETSAIKEPQRMPLTALPPAIASAVKLLKEGMMTPILSIDSAKAIVKLIKIYPAEATTPESARAKINALRDRVIGGEDFAKVAAEASACPSGKRSGGDLGEFSREMMVKEFSDAAFSQPIGEIGPVVETKFGLHIIKVTARDDAAGKVTASHILISTEPKEEEVELGIILKTVQPTKTIEEVTQELKNAKLADARKAFFDKAKAASKVTSKLFPELL